MRKIYEDTAKTEQIYAPDSVFATKDDINQLTVRIDNTIQSLTNLADALSAYEQQMAESVNTEQITAINASINMLEAATANFQSANIFNLTVEELATFKQLTTDLANIAQNLTVGGDVAIIGDIRAKNVTFDELTATSATIANWTIDNLTTNTIEAEEITSDAVNATNATLTNINSDSITADTANVEDATIGNAAITEATIGLANIDEVAIENIHWKDYQVYTADASKLYVVLPHFENGIYFLRARDGNQNTLFAVEVHNSVDNLFARWSQKEMNWVYKISKVGIGANTQCMLEVHNIDNVAFNLEYATICATPNVPAPSTYTEQPFPGNPMYKVSYQDGNKFFQNVDLANEGTTGAGLTMYATSNWALATTYYNYDGTMGIMSYNYLPNQSLNTGDNVEFYNLSVHGFSTENLDVPGAFKGKHIYDGPTLTAEEKAALPDETLLIEESQTSGEIPLVYALSNTLEPTTMADFFCPEDKRWKWSTNFAGCAAGGDLEEEYPGVAIDYFDYTTGGRLYGVIAGYQMQARAVAQRQSDNKAFVVFDALPEGVFDSVTGLHEVTKLDDFIGPNGFISPMQVLQTIEIIARLSDTVASTKVFDMNGEVMSPTLYNNQLSQVGFTFYVGETFEDAEMYTVASLSFPIYATNLKYGVSSGTGTLTRKTTKNNEVQIKPLIPFNDDGSSATDNRPLVYDRTSDTIKKATGDLVFPGDLEAHDITATNDLFIQNNAIIAGDLEVRGTTFSSEVENVQSDADWIVLRANNSSSLANGDYAGIVFHNYNTAGKDAAITLDNSGTFRLSTQTTESVSPLQNTWLVDEQYFHSNVDFSQATLLTENYPVTRYTEVFTDIEAYKSGNNHYFYNPNAETIEYHDNVIYNTVTQNVELAGNIVSFTPDPSVDTPHEVHFYTSISFMEPQASDMEAIATRDETSDWDNNEIAMYDKTDEKFIGIGTPTQNNTVLTSQIDGVTGEVSYTWKTGGSGSVSRFTTLAAAQAALAIPEGQDGYIPNNGIVIVDELDAVIKGDNQ